MPGTEWASKSVMFAPNQERLHVFGADLRFWCHDGAHNLAFELLVVEQGWMDT
jgi:hypothetical protein